MAIRWWSNHHGKIRRSPVMPKESGVWRVLPNPEDVPDHFVPGEDTWYQLVPDTRGQALYIPLTIVDGEWLLAGDIASEDAAIQAAKGAEEVWGIQTEDQGNIKNPDRWK